MSSARLSVITAGLSQPSSTRLLADRLLRSTERALREAGTAPESSVIELRDHAQDLTNHVLTGFPGPRLREVIEGVTAADGLICVSPIFNASYSGLFKLFWDVLERDDLLGVPVAIAATGGTARHSLALEHALRPLFVYLGASVMPTSVYAAAEDWGTAGEAIDGDLVDRIERAGVELAAAMGEPRRPPASLTADDDQPVPFEEMLASVRAGRQP